MLKFAWHKRHPQRLKAEEIIMQDRFAQFVLKKDRDGLFWDGILITNFKTAYRVNIIYPKNYPYQKPVFRVVQPQIKSGSTHVYMNGSLCVYPKNWNHTRCTAPAGVPLVAGWLTMYEIWLQTGKRW